MTLPADAIRNAKSGSRAPLEQFTRQQDKKRDREKTREPAREEKKRSPAEPLAPLGKTGTRDPRRKGRGGAAGAEGGRDSKLAGMASTRAARQQKRRRTQNAPDDDDAEVRRRRRRLTRRGTNTAAPRKGNVSVELPCTVRSLSEATGVPTATIQRTLLQLGKMLTINQELDPELAELVATELSMEVDFHLAETVEDQMLAKLDAVDDPPESLRPAHR